MSNIKICARNFSFDCFDVRLGNLVIKQIGFDGCFLFIAPFFVILNESFVFKEKLIKHACIENKPLVNVGNDKIFNMKPVRNS